MKLTEKQSKPRAVKEGEALPLQEIRTKVQLVG